MKDFCFLISDSHDPYFNLASEEYLLRQTDGYYIYLWRNEPAVIVGVNQNTIEEVNFAYTEVRGVKTVRRMTGGGAVYHDLGTVCYTVIAPFDNEKDHYRVFTRPVIDYLGGLGVEARFSGRNDITVDGKKISGNAETVYRDRLLHHGTILFDTDLTALACALKPNPLKTASKGIKSVRSRVVNVKDYLPSPMTAEAFFEGLCGFLSKDRPRRTFDEREREKIDRLVTEKYATYAWNTGYSPKGRHSFEDRFSFGIFSLHFDTENGLIRHAEIHGDFFSLRDVKELAERLDGVPFDRRGVETALREVGDYIKGATAREITQKMF